MLVHNLFTRIHQYIEDITFVSMTDDVYDTSANHMLRNCQEDIRFCYDIREKSYDKYDSCYAVPHR